MTGFADVKRSSCRILGDHGETVGTGFFVLPDGCLLTCHHVVFGLRQLRVLVDGDSEPRAAEYLADLSHPTADIAVLRVAGPPACVRLDKARAGAAALGFGFRPNERDTELSGHSFNGRLGAGQPLRMSPEPSAVSRLKSFTSTHRAPWNVLPDEFRSGNVINLDQVVGLERGISGGPVYDPEIRRVVGMFRAVEGNTLGYVIPMENALDNWPSLLDQNSADVPDRPMDHLVRDFGIGLVADGARPISPRARRYFDELFRGSRQAGGRTGEIARLDGFAAEAGGGYFFVTGPAGFGKTALLSRWLDELEGKGASVAFHFISRNEPAVDVLGSLCQQLLSLHGLGGDLPDQERDLRLLYADLLELPPPPGQATLIVIDGLDEVLGRWDVRKDLFPPRIGAGVGVIFSARAVADMDWPASVGLMLRPDRVMKLGRLARHEVADAVARARVVESSRTEQATSAIAELSAGDPFYVHDLLSELGRRGGDLASLQGLPHTHSQYLRRWWNDGVTDCGERPFADLMGSLAVARGPMRRDELVALSRNDSLRGANIDLLLESAGRYLDGGERDGYRLSHRRIHDFVENTLSDEIGTYQRRLDDYCLHEAASDMPARYVLLHGAEHIAGAFEAKTLADVLGAHWIHASWMLEGSFSAVAADFQTAVDAALRDHPPDIPRIVALSVARQTARDMADLPGALLALWVSLGRTAQVIKIARSLPAYGGRATGTLLAVAEELLRLSPDDDGRRRATEVIAMAVDILPLLHLTQPQREAIEALTTLIQADGIPQDAALDLLRRTAAAVATLSGPTTVSLGYGAIAEAWRKRGGDEEEQRRFTDAGLEAAESIEHPAERVIAIARLLPALQVVQPSRCAEYLKTFVADDTVLTMATALGWPATAVLEALLGGAAATPSEAAGAALRISRMCLATRHLDEAILGAGVAALVRFGREGDVPALFDGVAAVRNVPAAEAAIALRMVELGGMTDWADRARDAIGRIPAPEFPPPLVPRVIRTGDLRFAGVLLDTHPGAGGMAKECLKALREAPVVVPEEATDLVERLTAGSSDVGVLATAARALLAHGLSDGGAYAERAAAAFSSALPDGDTDVLRQLLAAALHEDGAYQQAAEAISRMTSVATSQKAYEWLVDAAAGEEPRSVQPYADALAELVSGEDRPAPEPLRAAALPPPDDASLARPPDHDALAHALRAEIRSLAVAMRAGTTSSPQVLAFKKMVSEASGDPASLKFDELQRVWKIAERAVGLDAGAAAAELLDGLIDVVLTCVSPGDVASGLGDIARSLGRAGIDTRTRFEAVLVRILRHSTAFSDPELHSYVCRAALDTVMGTGDFDWARELVAQYASADLAEYLGLRIEAAARSGSFDVFERMVVSALGQLGAAWLAYVQDADAGHLAGEVVQEIADSPDISRYDLLNKQIPMLAVLLRRTGGPAGLDAVVQELEAVDRRFLDAAALIAGARPAPGDH